ncbi:Putative, 10TM heavy-metal exporter [Anaerobranca californiensis DSM 14826]|jgi:uncharacterized membrane-anchored protein YhcB (DUF1043 family)|uniref:Putative, 10TM heavy-metal exporter n=1 Tax=Anaerobranca californiensis DSM 14826 TaxID=1120989 RepID=A0A1M6MVE9_9FIRM|nr:putative manganese transporter [Anaerobranca californiensis]SHJ87370.1 Putative, 10TM heavy-metal exporter [Anaerobranca californiensis DSM 14826]
MFLDIFELILDSMEGAFIEVGVFVGAVLLFFGYINFKKSGKFIENIEKSKKYQPIIGGLLGLTPGCGGAIFVMPLFFNGSVTFGTVIATLMSTMGDAAFVMIATKPLDYLIVSALMFIVGVATGYLVDLTPLGDKILKKYRQRMLILNGMRSKNKEAIESPLTSTEKITSNIINYTFWSLITIGLILGILNMMQIDINELFIPNLGLVIGVTGTALSVFIVIKGKRFLRDDTLESEMDKIQSLKQTFTQNALETAFVIMWVLFGYLAYDFLTFGVGGETI